MALFKVYHGDKNDLPNVLKDSYGYIVVNEEASAGTWIDNNSQEQDYGIGEWYIDTDTKRYRIAAAELVDEEGNLYSLDDIVQKDNLVDDFTAAVYDSSSQQSRVPALTQEEIRVGISVAKDEDSITKAYNITVARNQWNEDLVREGYYKNSIDLSEALHCGAPGATVPVPPLVVWSGVGSKTVYSLFEDVEVNDDKDVITFYVSASNIAAVTESNVGIIIIDHR